MRETAFQLIFEMAFHNDPVAVRIDEAILCRELQSDDYISRLCNIGAKSLTEIDAQIQSVDKLAKIERIPRVTTGIAALGRLRIYAVSRHSGRRIH
jgi:transcription termination factor NusB